MADALGIPREKFKDKSSRYATFETMNGKIVTIRISDHNATASNLDVIRIDQKKKVLDLIDSLRTNPAESERIGLNLSRTANLVKDFENPVLKDENLSDKSFL